MNVLKKVPCEECRNQKRRCNGNHPCERCGRLQLACVYLKNSTPDDAEFIQLAKEAALNEQVAFLEDQLDEMDTAVQTMKQQQRQQQQQQQQQQQYPTSDTPSLTSDDNSSVDSHDSPTPPITNSRDSYQLTTTNRSSSTPSWTLEVTKGSLCFKTQVKTHGDLLYHAQNLTQVIQLNDIIPFGVPRDPDRCILMQTMGVRLLYKSNKTRYKNALLILENISGTWKNDDCVNNDLALTATNPVLSPPLGTTLALVFAYVECPHFYHWAIGIPTFYRLFIQPLMDDQPVPPVSSALYAFCAVICTMNCDHVSKVLPGSLLPYYGQFYYEQARLSLADRFDDTSLELVTTYVFMAVYHWNLSQEDKSIRYADMAQRMAYLVLATDFDETSGQQYLDNSNSKDDTVHFYRIITYLKQTCAYEKGKEWHHSAIQVEPFLQPCQQHASFRTNPGFYDTMLTTANYRN
ncbi:hypothetical protein BCR42DRAFT_38543 [Absidia repens]|uniref:Zn(2)-C6 fungal-type domain-containing protein n=1 Tax=Absidia repens TaxID=90262 RepID=A0A1X2IHQ0_9FUNG|nr:hypothetical protein BCR42DRAFT_38543 [Absidia repens]